MPTMTGYAPGTPCWVDLTTTDLEAAKTFYGAVLGWADYDAGGEDTGFYTMPRVNGQFVAGMMTQMDEEKAMGVPPHWNTYVRVASADDAAKKAKELGATVVAEPLDVMDVGRMAVLLDPEGAAISVWQPNQFPGAGLVNEPGAFCWSELYVKDIEQAKKFYGALFGWGAQTSSGPVEYTEWQLGGTSCGGMIRITDERQGLPPNWLVYFAVDDADATIEKATSAGGTVHMGPMDIPGVGRIAMIADPQGAVFAIIKMEMAAIR